MLIQPLGSVGDLKAWWLNADQPAAAVAFAAVKSH
jgi:hypothetical protein